jgi:hypothetical protein
MITHNNLNYFITYILFSCIGHEKVLLQFQQTLAPSLVLAAHSIGASHQVSVHLAKQFQIRRFLEINLPETRIAYGSHVC